MNQVFVQIIRNRLPQRIKVFKARQDLQPKMKNITHDLVRFFQELYYEEEFIIE